MRLLLVEDDKRFGQILQNELNDDWLQVDLAPDGVEGILEFLDRHYDIVLLDVRMPRLGGLDALRIIRKLDPIVPAIIFSAATDPTELQEAELSGMAKFFAKPFDISSLRQEIAKLTVGDAPRALNREY